MSKWQPIETAPKDGTSILLWDGKNAMCAEFYTRNDGLAGWQVACYDDGRRVMISSTVTHWMPLPEPPTRAENVRSDPDAR